jgi:hypothetical protein
VRRRRLVGAVDRQLRRRECRIDVALLGVGLEARVDPGRLVQVRVVGAQLDVVRLLGVLDPDELPGLPRRLVALGDDGRDDLAAVGDAP